MRPDRRMMQTELLGEFTDLHLLPSAGQVLEDGVSGGVTERTSLREDGRHHCRLTLLSWPCVGVPRIRPPGGRVSGSLVRRVGDTHLLRPIVIVSTVYEGKRGVSPSVTAASSSTPKSPHGASPYPPEVPDAR